MSQDGFDIDNTLRRRRLDGNSGNAPSQDEDCNRAASAVAANRPTDFAQRFCTDEVPYPDWVDAKPHAGDQASSLPGRDFLGFREALQLLQFLLRLHSSFKLW